MWQENALKHCYKIYYISRGVHIGLRSSVVEISMEGFIPATIHATLREVEKIFVGKWPNEKIKYMTPSESQKKRVKIPVWVKAKGITRDSPATTVEELWKAGCQLHFSVAELRRTDFNFRLPATMGHDGEWLIAGFVPKSAIEGIFPYDGNKIHYVRPSIPVYSPKSALGHIWDWEAAGWKQDSQKARLARLTALKAKAESPVAPENITARKRKAGEFKAGDDVSDNRAQKRQVPVRNPNDSGDIQEVNREEELLRVFLDSTADNAYKPCEKCGHLPQTSLVMSSLDLLGTRIKAHPCRSCS